MGDRSLSLSPSLYLSLSLFLHVYIKVNRTNCLSVLFVICRQIVVFPFCYVLSFCPLDALAMTDIYMNSVLQVVCNTNPRSCVVCVFARLALYVPSCRTCLIVNVLSISHTNAEPYCAPLAWTTVAFLFRFLLFLFFLSHVCLYLCIYIRYEHEI